MVKIYNTVSKRIEEFIPIDENRVTMYVCGPTVYSNIHVGNARPVIFFDLVKKYLEYKGLNVYYVSNITDIDDKIIKEAKLKNVSEYELTNKYTNKFIEASLSVGSTLPDLMPKATNYIDEMISYIGELIEKGYAYKTDSGVYFRTTKVNSYGKISNQNINELEESVRIDNKKEKEDFRDFSLWKNTTDGLSFESPFGVGRPGWHTECAVMNHEIFKNTIDIHGGGSDLIFPHHENENVQSCAHNNYDLANYWMHVGRLDFNDTKMSKSLGNTVLVKDLKDPLSFRLLILAHHYRNPINFSDELIEEFTKVHIRIISTLKRTNLLLGLNINENNLNNEILEKFKKEMDNDFNTPNVITLILETLKDLNKTNDILEKESIYNSVLIILNVLGLKYESELKLEDIENYNNWNKAREEKNYTLADEYRNKLQEKGWI